MHLLLGPGSKVRTNAWLTQVVWSERQINRLVFWLGHFSQLAACNDFDRRQAFAFVGVCVQRMEAFGLAVVA